MIDFLRQRRAPGEVDASVAYKPLDIGRLLDAVGEAENKLAAAV